MVVVDTNVLACLLIEGDHSREAQARLERDPDWRSKAFLLGNENARAGAKRVTEDAKLRAAAPTLTLSLAGALA